MELKEFLANFADQFDDTDPEEIQAETKFHELEEWSSMIGMGVIALARTEYGKTITGAEIRLCETVKDLFELLNSK